MLYNDVEIKGVQIEVDYIDEVGDGECEKIKLYIDDSYQTTNIFFTEEIPNSIKEELLNLLQKKIKTYSKMFKCKRNKRK